MAGKAKRKGRQARKQDKVEITDKVRGSGGGPQCWLLESVFSLWCF